MPKGIGYGKKVKAGVRKSARKAGKKTPKTGKK